MTTGPQRQHVCMESGLSNCKESCKALFNTGDVTSLLGMKGFYRTQVLHALLNKSAFRKLNSRRLKSLAATPGFVDKAGQCSPA